MCFENNLSFHDNGKLGTSKPICFWRNSATAPLEATNSSAPYLPYCYVGGHTNQTFGEHVRTQAYVLTLGEHERKLVFSK